MRWSARRAALAAVLLSVAALAVGGKPLWRAAYPYLPRQVQAAPYVVRARMAPRAVPVPLPTTAPLHAPTRQLPPLEARPDAPGDRAETATETPSPRSAVPGAPAAPPAALLPAPDHQYQTWNNCGPATIGMALGVLGVAVPQAEAARRLKPDPDDKNVSPDELADFARSRGVGAAVRRGGSLEELKLLIAAGAPVVAEMWFIPEPGDEMGHYVLLHGYGDAAGELIAADSYRGPGRRLAYAEFDALWRVFNRTYVALYAPGDEPLVSRAWGPTTGEEHMYRRAAAAALAEAESRGDAFAWFNLGSALVPLGEPGAVEAFDRARALGLPWRMLWYQFAPFEAYATAGRWDDVEALARANLANAPNLEESRYWLGRALAARGDHEAAAREYRAALAANPLFAPAREALGDTG